MTELPPYPGNAPQPDSSPPPYSQQPSSQPYGQPYPEQPAYVPPVNPEAKSRIAAGLLGIFLGAWGIHRFYLGYPGIGILQIVVTICTLGIGGLWGFIEGILYLTAKTGTYSVDSRGIPLAS